MRRRGGGEEVRKHTHPAAHAQPNPVSHAIVHEAVAKGARCEGTREATGAAASASEAATEARDQLLRRTLAHSHRKVVGAARHQPRVPAAHHLHLLPSCKPVGPPAARTMRTRRSVSRVRREESGGSACCVLRAA